MPREYSKKTKAAAGVLGVTFGVAMAGGIVSIAVLSGMEDARDEQVAADVKVISLEVDKAVKQAIQDEGDTAKKKDVKDIIGDKYTAPVNETTSIFLKGTVERGYCIVGTDSEGEQSEIGITQFRNKEGVLNEGNFCPYDLDDVTRLTGPKYEGVYNDNEALDIIKGSMGFAGVLGAIAIVSGALSGQPKYEYHYDETNNEVTSSEPPKKPVPAVAAPVIPVQTSRKVLDAKLKGFEERYNAVKAEWSSYELDLVKILDFPAVSNMSVPATADFHKALYLASHLAPAGYEMTESDIEKFGEAVLDLQYKYKVMINEAKRLKWNGYNEKERASLRTAQRLLSLALNSGSTAHERQIAYKRLIKEMEGIIVVPEKAMDELEAKVLPELHSTKGTKEYTT